MLFLLRQIRHKLVQKNKVKTYLLYAIGEIVLVVVGILIAVQIDEAVTKNEKNKRKDEYILSLMEEIKADTTNIRNVIAYNNTEIFKLDSLKEALAKIPLQLKDLPDIQFTPNLGTLSNFHNSSFIAIRNVGDLELFNLEIRNELINFNSLQEEYIEYNKVNTSVIYETLNRHVINIPLGGILPNKLNNEYVDERYYKNYASTMNALLLQRQFLLTRYLPQYEELMFESVKMLKLLDSLRAN